MSSTPVTPRKIVGSGLCVGCGVCTAMAPARETAETSPAMAWNQHGFYKPTGPVIWLKTGPANFAQVCPFSPEAPNEDEIVSKAFPDAAHQDERIGRFEVAHVGYALEQEFRATGSSGGMVSWVLAELLRSGLIDGAAHVVPVQEPLKEGKLFRYRISRSQEELREGARSRYYPVELSEVLGEIRCKPGRYAVVGVPCFIKAIQLLRREDPLLRERIAYALGLFCGHMKSARLIESYAMQMGVAPDQIQSAEFRQKDISRPASTYTARITLRDGSVVQKDWWFLAEGDWGSGFFQNSACNFCDDVVAETADISFGDAWVEPYSSDGRGTNVVVTRSPILAGLIERAIAQQRLHLEVVDADFIANTQAAGLRQRREGLAYRLTWRRRGIRLRKRVAADAKGLSTRRKFIYRMRACISAWSHRLYRLSRSIGWYRPYLLWARGVTAVYHGLAYSRGRIGLLLKRFP